MKSIKAILLASGVLALIFAIVSVFLVNFNFGIIIVLGVSSVLICYGLLLEKLLRIKWLTPGILTISAFFLTVMVHIGFYGNTDNVTFNEDAVIVLGAGVRGENVSRTLAYRLDKAVEYNEKNSKAVIVVSGGQGPQEDITEALAMERYLIQRGVPKENIIKEEAATSTYENFLFSKEILDKLFEESYETAVITNSFHIFRAVKLAEITGFNITHYHAGIEWYSIPINYPRECLAIIKMWLLKK